MSDRACGAEQNPTPSRIATVPPAQPIVHNPLSGMPSVLAIRDLRRRVRRSLRDRDPTEAGVVQLLQLDPLATLRGLRLASAPVFGSGAQVWSVPSLVASLGLSLSRRLLDTPPLGVAGTTPIRRLWLHSVATACAARELATQSALLAPDTAYLLGLLHDLPSWLQLIGRHQRGSPVDGTAADWLAHWQLPEPLCEALGRRETALQQSVLPKTVTVVTAAETLAELAGFQHPDHPQDPLAGLANAGKDDLVQAQRLRCEVETLLRSLGLDFTMPDFDAEFATSDDDDTAGLFPNRRSGSLDEFVLSVLSCAKADSYRSIVTALTASAVRYAGYDRAFYMKWNLASGALFVRSKADSSSRRPALSRIAPNAAEITAMRRALEIERPVRVDAPMHTRDGLLGALSVDEALLVPLNREFATPSFLVLDRSLSLEPIQLVADTAAATTLGMTGSLLNENLVLRRRRQRADKFALIDPLTRLFNRRMGVQTLDQEIARADRSRQPLTVLMCDLDHFKHLNDSFGHLQGDQALRQTAQVLRQTLRRTDVICRFGGEEFLVVLPDTTAEDATVLAARLFTAVEARGLELALPITISIGLTTLRADDSVESLLHRADQALYASKGQGRNRFSADAEEPEPSP